MSRTMLYNVIGAISAQIRLIKLPEQALTFFVLLHLDSLAILAILANLDRLSIPPPPAAMGGIFSYTDSTVANFRQKDDAVNGAVGGCAAGVVLGAAARSVPMMFGGCAALAALIGTFDAAGKSLQGTYARPSPKDFALGDHDTSHGPGEQGWREAREARRQSFFKVSSKVERHRNGS